MLVHIWPTVRSLDTLVLNRQNTALLSFLSPVTQVALSQSQHPISLMLPPSVTKLVAQNLCQKVHLWFYQNADLQRTSQRLPKRNKLYPSTLNINSISNVRNGLF